MSLLETRMSWLKATRASAATSVGSPTVLVAATFTADPIVPYLGIALMDGGDAAETPTLSMAPYNQIFQLCYGWERGFGKAPPAAVLLLWRIEDYIRLEFQSYLRGGSDEAALFKVDELADAVAALRARYDGIIIAAIPPYPHSSDHDIRSRRASLEAGRFYRKLVERWQSRMLEISDISIVDLDGLQRYVGINNTLDARKAYLYRQPFTEPFWNEIAQDVAATIKQKRVSSKKCVVVDCDNTLWGGIVGEDGLTGISIGHDYPGSVFRDFQHQLLNLRAQGVMIALCSKNNEADVWEVFDKHDGMVLKREHVVAHRINWTDKPANIADIAKELNIGLDSLVFIDDNPMEIGFVREALPMVTTLLVPQELATFPELVSSYRGFDRESISEEDRQRSDMMTQERHRRELAADINGEDFRKALELRINLFEVRPEHVERVTQLINKTNQFNLTTIRKTQAEVKNILDGSLGKVLAWQVADRFGDYGLVGVAILDFAEKHAEIETLLMSCRVLGRGVENSVFASLADIAREHGKSELIGSYVPSVKNAMVADLYANQGFVERTPGRWSHGSLQDFAYPEGIIREGL